MKKLHYLNSIYQLIHKKLNILVHFLHPPPFYTYACVMLKCWSSCSEPRPKTPARPRPGGRDLKSAVWVDEKEENEWLGIISCLMYSFEFRQAVRHSCDGRWACCCPATSASSKRTFSTAGLIITERKGADWSQISFPQLFSCTEHGI